MPSWGLTAEEWDARFGFTSCQCATCNSFLRANELAAYRGSCENCWVRRIVNDHPPRKPIYEVHTEAT